MRDKELSYWTCRGVNTAGYFVATIQDEVVGTVSYLKEADHLEIFRLSVDTSHRKSGVAAALIEKIMRVGAILKVDRIKAQTSNAHESALPFYKKNNWTEVSLGISADQIIISIQVSREYHTGVIHGLKIVTFFKDVPKGTVRPELMEIFKRKSEGLETLQE